MAPKSKRATVEWFEKRNLVVKHPPALTINKTVVVCRKCFNDVVIRDSRANCCYCNRRKLVKRSLSILFRNTTTITEAEVVAKGLKRLIMKCIHGKTTERYVKHMVHQKRYDCNCDKSVPLKKSKITCMRKYGVSNAMQSPELFAKQRKSMFSVKQYFWPSRRLSTYQGYEHWLFDELLIHYEEDSIVTESDKIETFIEDGIIHTYFPDAQRGTVIYEVKSWHTYGLQKETTEKNASCCRRCIFPPNMSS